MLSIPNIQTGVSLAPYTTYKIGGLADFFVIAGSKDELVNAVVEVRQKGMPYFILGTGANILVGDLGFRGLVIKNEANNFSFSDNVLVSESGATIESLIKESLDRALSGLEHFVGIPSSVGGALWQNLHFLSPERTETLYIGNILESAEVLDEENNLLKVDRDFFNFGYDESILHGGKYLVTEASFRLTSKDKKEIQKQMDENMRWREEKQPQLREFPSCGSVFKKIDGVGAGRLIDKCGLKGYSSGGVQISEKHANYLINTGDATAKDVRDVIEHIQRVVKEQAGYVLEPEISFVGEFV